MFHCRIVLCVLAVAGLSACEEQEGVYRNLTGSLTCPGLSPIAQAHLGATPDRLARCGPQAVPPS